MFWNLISAFIQEQRRQQWQAFKITMCFCILESTVPILSSNRHRMTNRAETAAPEAEQPLLHAFWPDCVIFNKEPPCAGQTSASLLFKDLIPRWKLLTGWDSAHLITSHLPPKEVRPLMSIHTAQSVSSKVSYCRHQVPEKTKPIVNKTNTAPRSGSRGQTHDP